MLPSVLKKLSKYCIFSLVLGSTVEDFERFASKEPSFLLTTMEVEGFAWQAHSCVQIEAIASSAITFFIYTPNFKTQRRFKL